LVMTSSASNGASAGWLLFFFLGHNPTSM
jgi:hypothetical protein